MQLFVSSVAEPSPFLFLQSCGCSNSRIAVFRLVRLEAIPSMPDYTTSGLSFTPRQSSDFGTAPPMSRMWHLDSAPSTLELVHVESMPTLQSVSNFGLILLASDSSSPGVPFPLHGHTHVGFVFSLMSLGHSEPSMLIPNVAQVRNLTFIRSLTCPDIGSTILDLLALGSLLVLQSVFCPDFPLLSSNACDVGLALFLHSHAHLSPPFSMCAISWLDLALIVLDFLQSKVSTLSHNRMHLDVLVLTLDHSYVDAILSLRYFGRLETSTATPNYHESGSLASIKSLFRTELTLLIIDALQMGPTPLSQPVSQVDILSTVCGLTNADATILLRSHSWPSFATITSRMTQTSSPLLTLELAQCSSSVTLHVLA